MDTKNEEKGREQDRLEPLKDGFYNPSYPKRIREGFSTDLIPGGRNMVFGALWMVIGAGMTLYLIEASIQGQSFVLPVLIIVFGLVQLCKGVGQFFNDPEE